MAEPAPTGTVVPAPGANGSPPGGSTDFKVPDGKVLIDASEHERWARQREQLAGLTQFHGKASELGFKRPEDFGELAKFQKFLKDQNLTTDLLMNALAEEAKGKTGQDAPLDLQAVERHLGGKYLTKEQIQQQLDERDRLNEARTGHKDARTREAAAIEKLVGEILGEKATDFDRKSTLALFRELAEAEGARGLYPAEHPLAKLEYAPYDEKGLAKFAEQIRTMRGLAAGAEAAKIGDEHNKGKVNTPAGSSAPSSTRHTAKEGDRTRPGGKPHPDDVQAGFDKLQNARKQGTVSSAGG